jgi:hypothetical protein
VLRIVFVILIFISSLFCDESIDKQIEAISKAPLKDRYRLMNELKQKIANMKKRERIKAMLSISKSSKKFSEKNRGTDLNTTNKLILEESIDLQISQQIEGEVEENHERGEEGD